MIPLLYWKVLQPLTISHRATRPPLPLPITLQACYKLQLQPQERRPHITTMTKVGMMKVTLTRPNSLHHLIIYPAQRLLENASKMSETSRTYSSQTRPQDALAPWRKQSS